MAKIIEWTDEQQNGWGEWVASQPEIIQDLCRRFPPCNLYRLRYTNQKVTIVSYCEDGTLIVNVSGEYNAIMFDQEVFGIKPDDLEECDLPETSEPVGTLLTEEKDIEKFIDKVRPSILATRKEKQ